MRPTLVDLMRHGEPVGGVRFRGNGTDDPLSDLGWTQMWEAVGDHYPWDQVISSPMARSREFAVALSGRHGLPLSVIPDLQEIGMGAWEGRTPEDLRSADPELLEDFRRDPVWKRPPAGEALASLSERVCRVYDGLLAGYPGRHLLVVCHSVVSRAIIGRALQASSACWYRIRIDYAGVTRIRHDRFGASLQCVNARRIR